MGCCGSRWAKHALQRTQPHSDEALLDAYGVGSAGKYDQQLPTACLYPHHRLPRCPEAASIGWSSSSGIHANTGAGERTGMLSMHWLA